MNHKYKNNLKFNGKFLLSVSFLGVSLFVLGLAFPATPVRAIGGERAAILMPFDNGGKTWIAGDGPGQHPVFWNAWSADLHSTPGTAVKPRLQTTDGSITMSVAGISETCAAPNSAGKNVRVNISVDGVYAGQVLYGHLDNVQVSVGNTITTNTTLGYLKLWNQSSCWQDTLGDGMVHTHIEVAKGCYRNLNAWTNYGGSTAFGLLSSDYGLDNSNTCSEADVTQMMSTNLQQHPTAITRGDGMEVFYRGVGDTLVNVGWSPGSGWRSPQILATNVKSNPTAVARGEDVMDVFYVDNQNKLQNVGWNAGVGWSQAYERALDAVGDPVVIARTVSDMDVFYRSTSNNLVNVGWHAGSGWSVPQVRASGDVASNPTAIMRGWNNMDVFYRSTSNGLRNVGWNSNGWSSPATRVGSGLVGDPVAIARSTSDMDVFYRDNNDNLKNIGWHAGAGWGGVYTRSSGDVVSDPSATARGWNAMEVAYRSHGYNLKTVGWTSSGWGSSQIRGSGLSGEPQIINRGVSAMEVFYKGGNHLQDAGWNAGVGWIVTQINDTNNID